VQEAGEDPLLFHCAAGKDRTGFATAMILHALGVNEELIMRDYLSSSGYLAGKYPSAKGIFSVQEKFLQSAMEQIRESYGSVNRYLRTALDVDVERMRSLYLC
jgi:protein tyrosine/serine phosphatase